MPTNSNLWNPSRDQIARESNYRNLRGIERSRRVFIAEFTQNNREENTIQNILADILHLHTYLTAAVWYIMLASIKRT